MNLDDLRRACVLLARLPAPPRRSAAHDLCSSLCPLGEARRLLHLLADAGLADGSSPLLGGGGYCRALPHAEVSLRSVAQAVWPHVPLLLLHFGRAEGRADALVRAAYEAMLRALSGHTVADVAGGTDSLSQHKAISTHLRRTSRLLTRDDHDSHGDNNGAA